MHLANYICEVSYPYSAVINTVASQLEGYRLEGYLFKTETACIDEHYKILAPD